MPTTASGWVLFALMCASGGATSSIATTLTMSAVGRIRYTKGDIGLAYVFAAVTMVAALLLVTIEPPRS